MKSIVRTLVVCFLLLALPFQAFATAGMLPLVGPVAAPAHELPPCHRQMAMAHGASARDADSVLTGHARHADHASAHAKGKCGSCTACCVGAAMAPGLSAVPALPAPSTVSIPFRAGHLPSVDPVLPERPPSFLAA